MERRIAKLILSIQDDNQKKDKSLYTGDTGVCLALYLLGKVYQIPQAETEADKLFDGIYHVVGNIKDASFDKGLSGIGWAINLLNMYGCIKGNIDTILNEIDAQVYRVINKKDERIEINCTNGLLGFLVYLIGRLDNPGHKKGTILDRLLQAAIEKVINRIFELSPSFFPNFSKDLYTTSLWEFPILFTLLARVYDHNLYQRKIKCMLQCWNMYIKNELPYYNINKLSLATSLSYLNKRIHNTDIDEHTKILLTTVDFCNLEKEIDEKILNANEGLFYFFFVLSMAKKHIHQDCPKYAEVEMTRRNISERKMPRIMERMKLENVNISFVNGISGIAVMLSLYPDLFHDCKKEQTTCDELKYLYGKRSLLRQSCT